MLSTLSYAKIYNVTPDEYPYTILKEDVDPHVYWALYQRSIRKVSQLLELSPDELSHVRNIGATYQRKAEEYIQDVVFRKIILVSKEPDDIDISRISYGDFYRVDPKDYNYPIDHEMLNARICNALQRANKLYVSDLLSMAPEDILRIKNIGGKGARIIEEYIESQIK